MAERNGNPKQIGAVAAFWLSIVTTFLFVNAAIDQATAQSGRGLWVYAICPNGGSCTIGVADQNYARPGSSEYGHGWRRKSGRYNSDPEAWAAACNLHYSNSRFNSPDIAAGRVDCIQKCAHLGCRTVQSAGTGITDNASKQRLATTPSNLLDRSAWLKGQCADYYRRFIHTKEGHVLGGRRKGMFVMGLNRKYRKYNCWVNNTYGAITNLQTSLIRSCRKGLPADADTCQILGVWRSQ